MPATNFRETHPVFTKVAIEIPIFTPKLIAFIAKSAGIRERGGGRTRWSGLQSAEKERGEGGKKSEEARS